MTRIADGDRQAFWVIWGRYHQDLFWTYHRLHKGNRQEIHDSLSGLCIRLIEDLPVHASSIVNCRTWLKRVAVNRFIDTHRSRQRQAIPVGSLIEIASIADDHVLETAADPEQANADRLLLHKVLELLNGIDDGRLRRVARLRFIEEQSYRDIAATMRVSEELARKWIQQVREYLHRSLPEHETAQAPRKTAKPRCRRSRPLEAAL